MTPLQFLTLAVAAYCHIGLKALMQLTVVHGLFLRVFPISGLLAVVEVYVISSVARQGVGLVCLALFMGGSLGCCSSMFLHQRLAARKESR